MYHLSFLDIKHGGGGQLIPPFWFSSTSAGIGKRSMVYLYSKANSLYIDVCMYVYIYVSYSLPNSWIKLADA